MKLYSQKTLFLSVAATAFLVCLATIKFTSRNSNNFSEDTVTEESDSSSQTSEDLILETNTPVLKIDDSSARFTLDEQQNISVYEKCNEAVVNITTQVMGYNWFYEPVYTSSGSGSGSIIDFRSGDER